MRVLFTRVQYHGVSREQAEADRRAFPRTILVEDALSYNEATNCVVANVGFDIRQADKSTIAAYELHPKSGAKMVVPAPVADATFSMSGTV